MKALPYLFSLLVVIVAVLVGLPPAVEGQVFIPHAGRIIMPGTPTIDVTVAISTTNTVTPTVTGTATRTPTITPTPSISPTPTNSPTITLTPTKTGTPTTTPTITPTPTDTIGDGVIVLNTHHDYQNDEGKVTVVGEVRNDTVSNATNIRVTVTLYNNRTDVVDALISYVWLDVLKPKEKTCFEVVFLGFPSYNSYGFGTEFASTSDNPRPLAIVSQGTVYVQDKSAWNIFGQIGNTEASVGAQPLVYPQIIGTLYHEMGHVLDCMYVNSLADELAPGETSIWEMTMRPLPMETSTTYRVQAK